MGRSGHGTPCSVSSACSFYDQDEDFFLEESSLGSLGQGEILVGPGIMGTAPEPQPQPQQQGQGSPSFFAPAQAMPETAASPGVKASLLPSRRSKKEAAGSAPRRKRSSSGSNSASAMQAAPNNNLQLPRAASPKTGEILIKLQKLTQQQDPQHKVVNIHDPGPGPADAPGPGLGKGKPLLVLEFHDISYTVHKRRESGWLCGLRRRAGIGRGRSPEREMQEPEQQAQGDESESGNNVNPMARGAKVLLKEVSGEARDGEILAVMGPSGSGKSTLIDALAQRIARDSLEGSITLNGELVSNRLLRSISAYVMQDDLLFPMLTVHETLMFSANVRLPQSQSPAKKKARVAHLLEQLGLQRVANTIIGDEGHRGVSGGERRRVSIGIDIIHDPLLLFLDEPTSGLDSTSAYLVIRTLQRIAHTGSIVILSIHQPSYRILGLLDRLILLAHGQKIYGGPPSLMDDFFKDFGRPIPAHENSTEFALDLISELHQSPGGIKPLVEFYKAWSGIGSGSGKWRSSRSGPMGHATDVRGAISASISRGKLVATRASFDLSSQQWSSAQEEQDQDSMVVKFANPWYCEIPVLIRRTVINISRTPELFLMRLGTVMVTGFLLATIFWGLDHSPKGVQERLGFFAFAMSTTYYTCADALPVFLQERYIFMRETTHNAYRKSSYVLANAIIYVPFLALLSMAFALVIWWAVGLSGGGQGFLFFFLIIWASFWAGNSFVTFLSAVMPNVMLGYTIVVAMLAYFLLLSGFFIARNRIPHYWLWFHYLSIIKYPYEAVLINEFHHTTACFETGAQILYGTPLAALPPSAVVGMLAALDSSLPATSPFKNLNVSSCVTDGRAILQNQYVTQLGKWACLGVTVGFGVLFRICFYIVLRLGGKNTRH